MNYRLLCLKRGCFLALMGALLLQAGCAGSFSKPKVPSVIVVPSPDKTGNYTLANYAKDLTSYGEGSGPDAVKFRNKMVYSISAEIDYSFYEYETKLFLNEGQFHVGADFLQLGLAAASTVSIGARGKTILGALLTGVTGMNLSIDKNFFQQKTVQAIASSMEANRDQIKTTILKQLEKSATEYPFAAARADLIRYFYAGTLIAGLQKLGQTAATDAKDSKSDLTTEQEKPVSFTQIQVNCVKDVNSAIDAAIASKDLKKFTAFLKEMNVTVKDDASADDLQDAYALFGIQAGHDPAKLDKLCAAAQKTEFIKSPAVPDTAPHQKE